MTAPTLALAEPPPEVARPLRELAAVTSFRRWLVVGAVAQGLVLACLAVATGSFAGRPVWMVRDAVAVSPVGPPPTQRAVDLVCASLLADERGLPRLAACTAAADPAVAAWLRQRGEVAARELAGSGLHQAFVPESARESGWSRSTGRRAVAVDGHLVLAQADESGSPARVSRVRWGAELVFLRGADGTERVVRWRETAGGVAAVGIGSEVDG